MLQEAPELEQIQLASAGGEGRVMLGEIAKPAEQVWIAGQLREASQLRELCIEIAEKATCGDLIAMHCLGS